MALVDGVVIMEQEQKEDEICEKTEGWTREDVGKRIPERKTPNGTYYNEPIVSVFCQFCSSEFIGPSREAGGFLGGHECLHAWEISQAMGRDDGMVE